MKLFEGVTLLAAISLFSALVGGLFLGDKVVDVDLNNPVDVRMQESL
jgi:hypothetical protein